MKKFLIKRELYGLLGATLLLLLMGCLDKRTPPGANLIYGGVADIRYSYHYWQEGLALLMWYDFAAGGDGCVGTGSTEDTLYRLKCDVESLDGQSFTWEVHTSDGVTAKMWIDGQPIDLAQGNMFLMKSRDGEIEVEQLARNFTQLVPDNASIEALADSDEDIANFFAEE